MKAMKLIAAGALAAALALGSAAPANAATVKTAKCGSTMEVCRVTITGFKGGSIGLATSFNFTNAQSYTINKDVYGATIASGKLGGKSSTSVRSSYRGTITFTYYKGPYSTGQMSMATS